MKKTLCITLEYPPQKGGVATYLSGLFGTFDPERIVVLTSPSKTEWGAKYRILRHKLLWKWIRPRWIPMLFWLLAVIRREKIEQLIAGDVLPSGRVCLLVSWLFKIPYSVFVYGMELPIAVTHPRHRRELTRVLQNAKHIFTISSYTENMILETAPSASKPIRVYPCPARRERAVSEEKVRALRSAIGAEGKLVMLCVSRLVKRKGHSQIFRAMQKLGRDDLFFCIVGDGPNRKQLEERAHAAGLSSRVFFAGEVSDGDLPTYYAASDIFCMPNRELPGDVEGFGIVFLEANLYGLPVIGGRNGGVPDAVVGGETGLLVNAESISDIAHAIQRLADSPALRRRLGEDGRLRVERDFRYEAQGKILEGHL